MAEGNSEKLGIVKRAMGDVMDAAIRALSEGAVAAGPMQVEEIRRAR